MSRLTPARIGPLLLLAAAVVAADQITKAIARGSIEPGERIDFMLGIEFVRVANEGIAFGLLEDAGALVVVIAAVAFLVLLSYFVATTHVRGLWIPIGLLSGGALGNLIDRAREGFVTDFIDPPNWPAFNVADIAITVGVIALGVIYLREGEGEEDSGVAGGERV